MADRTPALAKLKRPRFYDAVSRPRLFTLLDDAATRPIVWISAPPGAGKSTLVASYVEARKRPCLWYHVDAADADPATLLHYLRIAAQQLAGKRAASLPLFTSEPQQDLGRFLRTARRARSPARGCYCQRATLRCCGGAWRTVGASCSR